MFTDEQIEALKILADNKITEDRETAIRNSDVNAHTDKVNQLNAQVLQVAEKYGVDPSSFQLQPLVSESAQGQQNFEQFTQEVGDLAKQQGLPDFAVKKVDNG